MNDHNNDTNSPQDDYIAGENLLDDVNNQSTHLPSDDISLDHPNMETDDHDLDAEHPEISAEHHISSDSINFDDHITPSDTPIVETLVAETPVAETPVTETVVETPAVEIPPDSPPIEPPTQVPVAETQKNANNFGLDAQLQAALQASASALSGNINDMVENLNDIAEQAEIITQPVFQGKFNNYKPPGRELDVMTDSKYFMDRLEAQMNWYDRKSSFSQKEFKRLKKLEFYIAASIPLLITFSTMQGMEKVPYLSQVLQVIAALGGVALVIANKTLELEEHYKNWKEYRVTCEGLQHERIMYMTRTEPYDEEDAFPTLVLKVESILNNESQKWKSKEKPDKPKPQAQQPKEDEPENQVT